MMTLLLLLYTIQVNVDVCSFFRQIGRGNGPYSDYTDNYRLGGLCSGGHTRYDKIAGGGGGDYYK